MADVEIHFDKIKARTGEAVFISIGDPGEEENTWIPVSQINDYTGDLLDDPNWMEGGSIFIPEWLALDKKLI